MSAIEPHDRIANLKKLANYSGTHPDRSSLLIEVPELYRFESDLAFVINENDRLQRLVKDFEHWCQGDNTPPVLAAKAHKEGRREGWREMGDKIQDRLWNCSWTTESLAEHIKNLIDQGPPEGK